ncbi:MAG: hypothetical protein ACLRSY_03500 [Acutalibacter sp.]
MIDYDIPFQWIYRKGQRRHEPGHFSAEELGHDYVGSEHGCWAC